METGIIFFIACVIFAAVLLSFILIKSLRSDPYQFEVITMSPGVNHHEIISGEKLEFIHDMDGTEYEIKSERLYRVKVGPLTGLWFRLRGIKKRFIVSFQSEQTEPIAPAGELKVTARILKEVNESRALDKALRGEFSMPLDLKKILLIMGFVVVVIIAYVLVMGGGLTL